MLLGSVFRVLSRSAKKVAEHSGGFGKGYLVLAQILCRFSRVPFELHVHQFSG